MNQLQVRTGMMTHQTRKLNPIKQMSSAIAKSLWNIKQRLKLKDFIFDEWLTREYFERWFNDVVCVFLSTDQKAKMTKTSTTLTWTMKMKPSRWMPPTHRHRCLRHWVTVTWRDRRTKIQNIRERLSERFVKACWCLRAMDRLTLRFQCREAILWFTIMRRGHNRVRWVKENRISLKDMLIVLFSVSTDVASQAHQVVAAAVHFVCTISIANILHSQLSNSCSTISFNAIITRINHEIISQLTTTTAATTAAELRNAPYTHQVHQSEPWEDSLARLARAANARWEQEVSKSVRNG